MTEENEGREMQLQIIQQVSAHFLIYHLINHFAAFLMEEFPTYYEQRAKFWKVEEDKNKPYFFRKSGLSREQKLSVLYPPREMETRAK